MLLYTAAAFLQWSVEIMSYWHVLAVHPRSPLQGAYNDGRFLRTYKFPVTPLNDQFTNPSRW